MARNNKKHDAEQVQEPNEQVNEQRLDDANEGAEQEQVQEPSAAEVQPEGAAGDQALDQGDGAGQAIGDPADESGS